LSFAAADRSAPHAALGGTHAIGASARRVAQVPEGRRRVVLGLAYDGTGFRGFAPQPGQRTVGGELMAALGRLVGEPVLVTCAGRTDAGVHALAQVVHVDLPESFFVGPYASSESRCEQLARALDRQLRPEVRVWRAMIAPAGFDARRSAISRRYRYDLDVAERPDPRLRTLAWRVERPIDLALLRLATDPVVGEHDFAGFCRRPHNMRLGPLTRRVIEARWQVRDGGLLRLEIEATAFCHQMVRSLVGAIVAVGTGRLRPSDIVKLLREGRREGAPAPAPACGLSLIGVRYPADLGGDWC
jgi:tRNA pseudouridine38-40 synthase